MPNFEEHSVSPNARRTQALEINYATSPHVHLRVGEGAELDLLEICGPSAENAEPRSLCVDLGKRAVLRHVRVYTGSETGTELSVQQEPQSQYQLRVVNSHSKSANNKINIVMAGEGAECDVGGVTVSRDHEKLENQIEVVHGAPRTASKQKFHQIAFDHGHCGIDSYTRVEKNIPHVQAHQSLRSLLMSPNASVHAKPQLQIGNDEIQCSHGATVGTLDDDQLFYLRCRGIGQNEAETVLLDAFINEILEPIADAALRQRIRAQC